MKGNKHFKVIFLLTIMACCLFSCNKSVNESAFISKLDVIDVSMMAGQYDSSIKNLKKLEKNAFSTYQRLGIIKRYLKMGEKNLAENFIKKSLKTLLNDKELLAVYSQILLRQNRFEEAEEYSKKLVGTSYASIYSEVLFKKTLETRDYFSNEYIPLYIEAAKSTGDSTWLRNAAVIHAGKGNIEEALKLKPQKISTKDYPYFWALLEYDSENYVDSLETLDLCGDFIPALQLKSDNYLKLNEIELANNFWLETIENVSDVPLEIYFNGGKKNIESENYELAYNIISSMIEKYPDSEKALALYGNYALLLTNIKKQNKSTLLKSSNMKTLAMEKIDNYPRIPISDVLYRMEKSLEKNYSSPLYVEYLKLKWINDNYTEENCLIDIWNALEQTTVDNTYDEYILNYAMYFFANHHKESEGEALFLEYISQKYGYEALGVYANQFDDWEVETAAWYCVKKYQFLDAVRLYENLCFERNTKPSYYTQINLGSLYYAMGEEEKALKVYGDLVSKNVDDNIASELHYRIGCIHFDMKDKKNALLSLNYSVKLNPDNHKARLLLKQIK